jgi:glycosyltransferase involved in cell wall biosynthesis
MEAIDRIESVWSDHSIHVDAANRCRQASEPYRFDRVYQLIAPFIDRAVPRRDRPDRAKRPMRLAIAAHDTRFLGPIQEHYGSFKSIEIREDPWRSHTEHDRSRSLDILEWADVILCEWCVGNAVWYSHRKRPGQRLIVRLHRFELDTEFPRQTRIDNVDAVVCVGEHFRALTATTLGWPDELVRLIPNGVDVPMLDRRKLPGAAFTLGMLGILPKLKRLDLAFDVLELLRSKDNRFRLVVKGLMPWELDWLWRREHERRWYERVFERLERSPLLQEAVSFEPRGADVAAWLRTVGFILSMSDIESFHVSVAEGMAARSVPVILNWEGAEEIYDRRWIHSSTKDATSAIESTIEHGWRDEGDEAHDFVATRYSTDRVLTLWDELVLGSA